MGAIGSTGRLRGPDHSAGTAYTAAATAYAAGNTAPGVASSYGVASRALRRARERNRPVEVTQDDRSNLA